MIKFKFLLIILIMTLLVLFTISNFNGALPLFLWAIVLFLSFLAGCSIEFLVRRDYEKVTKALKSFEEGNYSKSIFIKGKNGKDPLFKAINLLSINVSNKISSLEMGKLHNASILETLIEGVLAVDSEKKIVFANDRFGEILGFKKSDFLGRPYFESLRNSEIIDSIDNVLTKQKSFIEKEVNIFYPENRILKIITKDLVSNKNNRGALLVLYDITEIKKFENMRKDFVANVSHELKTPLTSIKGFVETLLDGA